MGFKLHADRAFGLDLVFIGWGLSSGGRKGRGKVGREGKVQKKRWKKNGRDQKQKAGKVQTNEKRREGKNKWRRKRRKGRGSEETDTAARLEGCSVCSIG